MVVDKISGSVTQYKQSINNIHVSGIAIYLYNNNNQYHLIF